MNTTTFVALILALAAAPVPVVAKPADKADINSGAKAATASLEAKAKDSKPGPAAKPADAARPLRTAAAAPVQDWAVSNAAMPVAVSAFWRGGSPDRGPAPGEMLLVDFDRPSAPGVRETSAGNVMTAAGSVRGVRAAPAGNSSVYRSLGNGGASTFDFSGWSRGTPLTSLSFEWGSVDTYNFADFLNSRGETVWTVAGSDLPVFNGDQHAAITNQRLFVTLQRDADITGIRMRSKGAAFEFDSIAGTAAIVPEPESWMLLIAGFGFVGHAMRRRRARAASA